MRASALLLSGLLLLSVRAEPVEARRVSPASYASPAKAGAQLQAGGYWAPAFAGEASFVGRDEDKTTTASASSTPIDAERAFAADAQTLGQWTAFRKWATADATMFVPQPVNAQEWLKDKKDPPKAIDWWPTASYISCDGTLAVNTGGWKRPDGKVGYFSTVWLRQSDGSWKWIVDGGDELPLRRILPVSVTTIVAKCDSDIPLFLDERNPNKLTRGSSADQSLLWSWEVASDGSREFHADVWNGKAFKTVVSDYIGAPAK